MPYARWSTGVHPQSDGGDRPERASDYRGDSLKGTQLLDRGPVLRCESRESMFDLRDVVLYIARRIGMLPGRVWFGCGSAINARLGPVRGLL